MYCFNIFWHFPQFNVALMASADNDNIFGSVDNLRLLARRTHTTLITQSVTIGTAVARRVSLMEEWRVNHIEGNMTFFINVNAREHRRVVDMTMVVIQAGHIGLALWDMILDCSFSRWKLQDVRDEVCLLYKSFNT